MNKYNTILQKYRQEIGLYDLLSSDEEFALFREYHAGSVEARNRIFEGNLRLVLYVISKLSYTSASALDIIQEGNIGLLSAIEKFDPFKNIKFATYAYWWITKYVRSYLITKERLIRLPIKTIKEMSLLKANALEFMQTQQKEPTYFELEEIAQMEGRALDILLAHQHPPASLKEQENLKSLYPDDETTFSSFDLSLLKKDLSTALEDLSSKEARVVKLSFGLGDEGPCTLKVLGEREGLSPERIRQIIDCALEKIKNRFPELRDWLSEV